MKYGWFTIFLMYNIVLVSGGQSSEWILCIYISYIYIRKRICTYIRIHKYIYTHIYILFQILLHYSLFQDTKYRSSHCGSAVMNWTSNWIKPLGRGFDSWPSSVGVAVSCGIGGLDLALLWLWRRPVAAAPIQPLAWELSHAAGVALKRKKKYWV